MTDEKKRYSESQIIKVLKEVEGGRTAKAVCREYGFVQATYYTWKSKYGGMEASDIKRLKELEDENRRLKQMYADLSLDHKILKDIVGKNLYSQPYDESSSITRRRRIRSVFDGPVVLLAFVIQFIDISPIPHETMWSLPVYSKRSKNIQRMALASYSRFFVAGDTDGITNASTESIAG